MNVKIIQRHGIWVSLLAHILLLGAFSVIWWRNPPDLEKRPSLDIPSYIVSHESATPRPAQVPAPELKTETLAPQEKPKPTSKLGIEKPVKVDTNKTKSIPKPPSAPAAPAKATQKFQALESLREEQGVHLIGDEKIDKSLRVILGKSISKYLFYPKSAVEHRITGTVLVGFTLHPDGQVTNIQLVKPSSAGILNSAALAAINGISPVQGVREFISEPRPLVVGIIFSGIRES